MVPLLIDRSLEIAAHLAVGTHPGETTGTSSSVRHTLDSHFLRYDR